MSGNLREPLHGHLTGNVEYAGAVGRCDGEHPTSLEQRLLLLRGAVAVSTRGLKQLSVGDIDNEKLAAAHQEAHRVLTAQKLTTTASGRC